MIHSYENLIAHQYEMSTPFNSTLVRIPYPPCWGIAICSLICPGNARHTVGSAWLCRTENMQDSLPTGHQGVNLLIVWPQLMGRDEIVMWKGVNVASQSSGLGSTVLASPSPCRGSQRWQAHPMRQSREMSVLMVPSTRALVAFVVTEEASESGLCLTPVNIHLSSPHLSESNLP